MSEVQMRRTEVSDDQVRAMLDLFAGPASPQASAGGMTRRVTRRTVILLVAVIVALGLAVPGALALLGYWETPRQFLTDSSQPEYAKRVVRLWLADHGYKVRPDTFRLVALTRGVTTSTPAGDMRAYALRFSRGKIGFWVFTGQKPREPIVWVVGASGHRPCPNGWALQYLMGTALRVGRTPAFAVGRAAPAVASVSVRYRDGLTTAGAVTDGVFLVWMKPSAASTNVTVLAKNAAGDTIATLVVAGNGGVPSWSLKPPSACAP